MLNKDALKAIKQKLPKDGIQMISEKTGVSKDSVKKILNEPSRFNKKVIEAALKIIEAYELEINDLVSRANNLISK